MTDVAVAWLNSIGAALGTETGKSATFCTIIGEGALPSLFPVSDLAAASFAAVGVALADLVAVQTGRRPAVTVDRRLASFWFGMTLRPQGWAVPAPWDPLAGDYQAADGWIRLHTNAPHHRRAALAVLGDVADKTDLAQKVSTWQADALEAAIVAAGGCAATMRSLAAWAEHPQGRAVAAEPLIAWTAEEGADLNPWPFLPSRPLHGLKVLDLTRVLAGPVATRCLAGFGAEVLRIDSPDWDEPGVVPEVTLGKRCARLDLRQPAGKAQLQALLAQADVLVHGYRGDALEGLGLGAAWRRAVRPGLIDVSLNAYGWTGPWSGRRGFDSLVQMSAGIAAGGMVANGTNRPVPLPVQALDHAAGYLLAAATLRGLALRLRDGSGFTARTSLARVAALLAERRQAADLAALAPESSADLDAVNEATSWGPACRIRTPLSVDGVVMQWVRPATALGSASATWA